MKGLKAKGAVLKDYVRTRVKVCDPVKGKMKVCPSKRLRLRCAPQ